MDDPPDQMCCESHAPIFADLPRSSCRNLEKLTSMSAIRCLHVRQILAKALHLVLFLIAMFPCRYMLQPNMLQAPAASMLQPPRHLFTVQPMSYPDLFAASPPLGNVYTNTCCVQKQSEHDQTCLSGAIVRGPKEPPDAHSHERCHLCQMGQGCRLTQGFVAPLLRSASRLCQHSAQPQQVASLPRICRQDASVFESAIMMHSHTQTANRMPNKRYRA